MRTLNLTLCVTLAVSLFVLACNPKNPYSDINKEIVPSPITPPEIIKTITLSIENNSKVGGEIRQIDIFSYSDHLINHRTIPHYQDTIHVPAISESGIAVILANAFGSFNEDALIHYDNWDNLELSLKNERMEAPIMGGKSEFIIKKDSSITVSLTPLISIIHIRSITHHFSDDVILENPRIWIEGISNKARLYQKEGYTPLEQSDSKPIILGTDIGVYTQYPDIKIVVYPNEMPPTFSSPTTKVVLEYEYNGKDTRQFRYEVHPIYRNTYIPIDLDIW